MKSYSNPMVTLLLVGLNIFCRMDDYKNESANEIVDQPDETASEKPFQNLAPYSQKFHLRAKGRLE